MPTHQLPSFKPGKRTIRRDVERSPRNARQPGSDKHGNSTGAPDMSQILVDTNILIDVANNDAIAKARLTSESQTSTLAVSTVTVMELTVGCRNKSELHALNRFLSQFQVLTLNSQISDCATQLLQDYFLRWVTDCRCFYCRNCNRESHSSFCAKINTQFSYCPLERMVSESSDRR